MSEKNSEFEFIQGLTAELSSPALIFPTSLTATMNIRRAISQENISNDNVARIVSTEPVLSAQILKLSNSAAYNSTGKINTDLRTATMRLGFVKVRNLTITVGMKQLSEHKGEISGLMEGLWNRSLRVGTLSSVLAKHQSRINPDNAMLAGLLHDVGKFYILNRANHYLSLFTSQQALWNLVDAWHSNIGAAILENWEIPDEIRNAVQDFGTREIGQRTAPDLTDIIIAADLLDAHIDERSKYTINWETLPASLTRLHLNADNSKALLDEAKIELDIILKSLN